MKALVFIDSEQASGLAMSQAGDVHRLGRMAAHVGALIRCSVSACRCIVMKEIPDGVTLGSSVDTGVDIARLLQSQGYIVDTYDVRDLLNFLEQYNQIPF